MKRALIISLLLAFCPLFIGAADKIELNTASLSELEEITGVGPVIAQRIIDGRPYSFVDDLLKVKGIGEKTLQKIKDQGLATVSSNYQVSIINESPKISEIQITKTYPAGIIISEILPSPEGADEANEFIELHNSTTAEVDISGWKLQDIEGTQTTYTIPAQTTIAVGGHMKFTRPQTGILLNNDADGVNLLWPDGKVADTISYQGSKIKESYRKTEAGWSWSGSSKPKALLKAKKTVNKVTVAAEPTNVNAAALSVPLENSVQNPWLLFLAAAAITIISGLLFLILKLTLLKKDVRS